MNDWTCGRRSAGALVLALLVVAAVGCGGGSGGRYRVSGKVTFAGKPIPVGRIYFDPNLAKKNDGLQGTAEIKNGEYDTAKGGQGTTAGPVIVRIEGADGTTGDPDRPNGKPLFPSYQTELDLPKQNTTRDFDVPASAAMPRKGPVAPVGP